MKSRVLMSLVSLGMLLAAASVVHAQGTLRVPDAIWVDGELYDTVITPTSFTAPPEQSTDVIYSFMMSGLEGQRSVAESAPGDPDYNGGRWDVQMVVFTEAGEAVHDPDGDGFVNFELMSDAEVLASEADGNLEIMDANFYFVCPLRPRRGNG
jgi:hypothetical protein